jgi:hypothetical protein
MEYCAPMAGMATGREARGNRLVTFNRYGRSIIAPGYFKKPRFGI